MSLPTNPDNGNFYGGQPQQGGGYPSDGYAQQNSYNQPPASSGKGKRIGLIAGASVLTLGLLAGGAYAVTNGLNAFGDKDIAKAMPGNTAIFGEIDLDPSNAQKVGLVSLAEKVKAFTKDKDIDPNKDPKEMITDGFFKDLDYETEVKPWIGDKVAVGAWGDFSKAKDYAKFPTKDGSLTDEKLMKEYSENESGTSGEYSEEYPDTSTDNSDGTYVDEFYSEDTTDSSASAGKESFNADRASNTTAVRPKAKADGIHNVIVYEIKDKKKAQEAADKAFANKPQKFVVTDGYLVIAENQEDLDAYNAETKNGNLAEQESFKADRKTFNKDAIATGWADLGRFDLGASAKEYSSTLKTKDGKPFTVEGRVITGVSLEQGKASSVTKFIEVKSNAYDVNKAKQAPGVKDIGNLPADTFGAVALSGLDQSIKDAWEQNKDEIESDKNFASTKQSLQDQYGISLPEDLTKIFGSETVIGVGGPAGDSSTDSGINARLTGADKSFFDKVLAENGAGSGVKVSEDNGVTIINYFASDAGKLGDTENFKKAVGDYKNAQFVGFANLDKIAELSGSKENKGMGSVGMNGEFNKADNVTTFTVNWVY